MRNRIPIAAFILWAAASAFSQPAAPAAGPEGAGTAGSSPVGVSPVGVSPVGASPVGASPVGWWKTIDDKTGQAKSIVHIRKDGDGLAGDVEKLFRRPEEEQRPVCHDCAGDRKDKPILGMTILWGMRPAKEGWDNGSVLDPNNGKIYRCKLALSADGQSLTVRGYLGISLLGRSQTWKRVPQAEIPKGP